MVGTKRGQAPRRTSSSPTGPASPCSPGGQGWGCLDGAVWGEEGGVLSTAHSQAGSLNVELFTKQIAGSGKGFTIIYEGGRTHSLPGVPHCQSENTDYTCFHCVLKSETGVQLEDASQPAGSREDNELPGTGGEGASGWVGGLRDAGSPRNPRLTYPSASTQQTGPTCPGPAAS